MQAPVGLLDTARNGNLPFHSMDVQQPTGPYRLPPHSQALEVQDLSLESGCRVTVRFEIILIEMLLHQGLLKAEAADRHQENDPPGARVKNTRPAVIPGLD